MAVNEIKTVIVLKKAVFPEREIYRITGAHLFDLGYNISLGSALRNTTHNIVRHEMRKINLVVELRHGKSMIIKKIKKIIN